MRVLFDAFEKALKGRFMALSGLDLLGGGSSVFLTKKLKNINLNLRFLVVGWL